jgi:hypothetical protein
MRWNPVVYPAGLLLVVVSAGSCSSESERQGSSDSAFAQVQNRGHQAMGVDQYTSAHRFEPLPDGGRITLVRGAEDSAGAAQIRRHMQSIASAFARGDFTIPGFVHDREVPGTKVMAARQDVIAYSVDFLPRGAQLRIHSDDLSAIAAIHEFLAFQRRDHRVAAGPSGETWVRP